MTRQRTNCVFRTDKKPRTVQPELGKPKEVLTYKGLKGVYYNSISRNPSIRMS